MRVLLAMFVAMWGLVTISLTAEAAKHKLSIIPEPVQVYESEGVYKLSTRSKIGTDKESLAVGQYLSAKIKRSTGYNLKAAPTGKGEILLSVDTELSKNSEAYTLKVTPEGVAIVGASPAGVFYGVQSFLQLFPAEIYNQKRLSGKKWECPAVSIKDEPRFKWRGMHVDVARHFMPIDFLKRFIDQLATHKMNRLHLHLTEDQGWRIEIKKYPKLTQIGSKRKETMIHPELRKPDGPIYDGKPHGGYYTQSQLKDLVKYAEERFVTIMPEIEMPGHSQAALAAYPEFGCTGEKLELKCEPGISPHLYNVDEKTFTFLQDILTEVMAIFPSEYIHIGGDEAPKGQWKKSPVAQAKMKELKLKNEEQLQSWFIDRIGQFLLKNGRRLVGWQEITHGGTPKGAVVMPWMNMKSSIQAAKKGHDIVIATTYPNYFDSKQSNDPTEPPALMNGPFTLKQVYNQKFEYKELASEKHKERILGAQGQLWSEYMPTYKVMEYQAFPRAIALAEAVWSPLDAKDFEHFQKRLVYHGDRMKREKVNHRYIDPVPIYEWSVGKVKGSEFSVDVTDQITSAGEYIFEFKNISGKDMKIINVQLLIPDPKGRAKKDKVIDVDKHFSIIRKANPFNNLYRFNVKRLKRRVNYSLKITLEGACDCDGEIRLFKGRSSWKFMPSKVPEGVIPVGTWDKTANADAKYFYVDVTGVPKSTGLYDVEFKHVDGGNLKIKGVSYYYKGRAVSSDMHEGTAGKYPKNNLYQVNVKGNKGKLKLKVVLMEPVRGTSGYVYFKKSNILKKIGTEIGKPVAEWSRENLPSKKLQVAKLDVADIIKEPGEYQVILQYTSGGNAIAIHGVEFWDDGRKIVEDKHKGNTGSKSKGNTYKLNIRNLKPEGKKLLKVKIQGQGGVDSNGQITITTKELKQKMLEEQKAAREAKKAAEKAAKEAEKKPEVKK